MCVFSYINYVRKWIYETLHLSRWHSWITKAVFGLISCHFPHYGHTVGTVPVKFSFVLLITFALRWRCSWTLRTLCSLGKNWNELRTLVYLYFWSFRCSGSWQIEGISFALERRQHLSLSHVYGPWGHGWRWGSLVLALLRLNRPRHKNEVGLLVWLQRCRLRSAVGTCRLSPA